MRIVIWVKGERGRRCLEHLLEEGVVPVAVVLQSGARADWRNRAKALAGDAGLPVHEPADPHLPEFLELLGGLAPDLFVLAGWGTILTAEVLRIPVRGSINLHGGKVPEYRGSSPMNWALISGETTHTATVLEVDEGIDSGPVLAQRSFDILPDDIIADLHSRANEAFPRMLVEVIRGLEAETLTGRKQDESRACYWPQRFPEDGFLLWDRVTAQEAHDRIRALTTPYPCAYTYHRGRKVLLLKSRLHSRAFNGEPGRIYQVKDGELLVGTLEGALWITAAEYADSHSPLAEAVKRYDRLGTLALAAEELLKRMDT